MSEDKIEEIKEKLEEAKACFSITVNNKTGEVKHDFENPGYVDYKGSGNSVKFLLDKLESCLNQLGGISCECKTSQTVKVAIYKEPKVIEGKRFPVMDMITVCDKCGAYHIKYNFSADVKFDESVVTIAI